MGSRDRFVELFGSDCVTISKTLDMEPCLHSTDKFYLFYEDPDQITSIILNKNEALLLVNRIRTFYGEEAT